MLTLEIREYQGRVRRRLAYAFVAISIVTVVVAFLLPGRPLLSGLLGIAASGALLATSAYTMNRMVDTEGMAVGWVAVDYLVKVVVVIGSLLLAKYVTIFDPIPVAVTLALSILTTSAIQVTAVRMKQRVESDLG